MLQHQINLSWDYHWSNIVNKNDSFTFNSESDVSVFTLINITPVNSSILYSQVWYEQREISWRVIINQLKSLFVLITLRRYLCPVNFICISLPCECLRFAVELSAGAGQQYWVSCVCSDLFCLSISFQPAACMNTPVNDVLMSSSPSVTTLQNYRHPVTPQLTNVHNLLVSNNH